MPWPDPARRLTGLSSVWVLLLSGLAASSAVQGAPVSVIDDMGTPLRLDAAPRRIISLAPHVTELVYAAGGGSRLIAASEFSDYPRAAQSLPRVAGGGGMDLEAIVSLRPDLIIAWQSGNGARAIEKLRALRLPVYVTEPRSLMDVPRLIESLGRLMDTNSTAQPAAKTMIAELNRLRKRFARRAPVRVFYVISDFPLMTLNGEHIFSDVLQLCAGRNVFAELSVLAPTVGVEAVINADPEVIFLSSTIPRVSAVRSRWLQRKTLRSARAGHVYILPTDLINRQSPRLVQGARRVCEQLAEVRGDNKYP